MTDDNVDQFSSKPRNPLRTGRRFNGAIAKKLGIAIVSGAYAPGTILGSEIASSEALDVSRTAYREAIQILTAKGLIESRPKAGTRVLPRDKWNLLDPDVLAWAFAGDPGEPFILSLFELRGIVEPTAASLAARRRKPADLAAMRNALEGMRRYSLVAESGRTADREFHEAILRATCNEVLVVLSSGIGATIDWTAKFKQPAKGSSRDSHPDHIRVYEAIVGGDPEAAEAAMRALVDLEFADMQLLLK